MIHKAFAPSSDWGPREEKDRQQWLIFKEDKAKLRSMRTESRIMQTIHILFKRKTN